MYGYTVMKRIALVAFCAILLTAALPRDSRADVGPWTASEVVGVVRVMPIGSRAVALNTGDLVASGAEVETGADGRLGGCPGLC